MGMRTDFPSQTHPHWRKLHCPKLVLLGKLRLGPWRGLNVSKKGYVLGYVGLCYFSE